MDPAYKNTTKVIAVSSAFWFLRCKRNNSYFSYMLINKVSVIVTLTN